MPSSVRAIVEPAMLVWARKSAGLSVEELARRLGIAPSKLQDWEAGTSSPTVKQLQRLAAACKRPSAVLYLSEPPTDFMPLRDFRRLPGDGLRAISPELTYQIRRAQERRAASLDLSEAAGFQVNPFELRADTDEAPEEVGARIRNALGVTLDAQSSWSGTYEAFNSWRSAAENLGVLVFQARDVEVSEIRGFSLAERIAPTIVVNTKDTPNGRTFSLLHEFAHLMLRVSGICDLDDETQPPEERRIEVFCNAVAAAALMPRDQFLAIPMVASTTSRRRWSDTEIAALSRTFRVSREAVLRRLLELGRTTLAFYREKRHEYAAEYSTHERSSGGFAPPHTMAVAVAGKPFVRLVLQSYYQDRISLSAVSDYLGVRVKHLPRIEAAVW